MALVRENFARNLTALLEKYDRKPIELARYCKVNPSTVNGWMTARIEPKLGRLDDIADFFGPEVTYMDLLRAAPGADKPRDQESVMLDLEAASREFLRSRGHDVRPPKKNPT